MTNPPLSIPLYVSVSHQCDYLPARQSQSAFIDPAQVISPDLYEYLLSVGFRRSGKFVYKPHCEGCQACIPCRLAVNTFKISKSQKRILNKNKDLTSTIIPSQFSQEHFDLYLKYQKYRHAGGSMEKFDQASYRDFICQSIGQGYFIETRLNGELVAVAVTDVYKNANSAVYTFFDPELQKRSLGTYSILKQIELTKEQKKLYLYLGYYIKECKKMAYKISFKPLEKYQNEQWQLEEIAAD